MYCHKINHSGKIHIVKVQSNNGVKMKNILTCYIVTYNRAEYLKKQIDSVLRQTFKDFKLVILDNASTDTTEDLVDFYSDERIEYIRHKNNIGGIGNINYALEHCKSKYLIILHDDDCCSENLFEKEICVLEENAAIDIVSTNAIIINENDDKIGLYNSIEKNIEYEEDKYFNKYFNGGGTLIFPTIMYRHKFLVENNLKLDKNVGPCAHLVFEFDIFINGGKGIELAEPLFFYRQHLNQDSHINMALMHNKLYDYLYDAERFSQFFKNLNGEKQVLWKRHVRSMCCAHEIIYSMPFKDAKMLLESYAKLFRIDKFHVKVATIITKFCSLFKTPLLIVYKLYKNR